MNILLARVYILIKNIHVYILYIVHIHVVKAQFLIHN